ncbi:VRR-NUC domain-containing protein [Acetobacteraceae bacterium KSS8]|uniref:VRR-NUC domain-containing protein n=1 Tax=Endosaccharibacter trunci TaxID=2812733 RepID=A0ABT1WAG9_9PROT|nr:VRR-NUC domain-containing protein [Acetobacteraceae bacterium KSS8]
MTMHRSEAAIQADILVAITALPSAMFWRSNSGVATRSDGKPIRFGVPGQPDILGAYRGQAYGIEVKSPTGRQRKEQAIWQRNFERAGGRYILARSVDDALAGLRVSS